MKYNPPLGGGANDPYVDGNQGAGVDGSTVPAAAVEYPQREIAAIIAQSPDIVASDADNTQAVQSIRRIAGNYVNTLNANTVLTPGQAGLILIDGSGGPVTLTLPAANGQVMLPFTFVRIDTAATLVTVQAAGADGIDEGTSFRLWVRDQARSIKADGVSKWRTVSKHSALVHGRCYLQYVDATHISLVPQGGDGLQVNGDLRSLGAGIVSTNVGVYVGGVAAQNLAASTSYLVYAFDNGGTLTYDFWPYAGGHVTDTNAGNLGVEVRSNGGAPDSTRTLVGMVTMSAAAQFQAQGVGVSSWFNPVWTALQATGGSVNFSNTGVAEISTSFRVSFQALGKRAVLQIVDGFAFNNTSPGSTDIQASFDGVANGSFEGNENTLAGAGNAFSSSNNTVLAEGPHYATALGGVNAGQTGTVDQIYNRVWVWG